MEYLKLSPRLERIASLVPEGARLADVGTDHGFLPISLIQRGKIISAAATDIREGPLARAGLNAEKYEIKSMRCILCDGLEGVSPGEADTVVIAGMGGENIADILRRAPWACRDALLLLQPMSRPELLRSALPALGLRVIGESLVRDSGKLYCILTVRHGEGYVYSPGELYVGAREYVLHDPLFPDLAADCEKKLLHAVGGLSRSEREEDRVRLMHLRAALEDIHAMQEEAK